MPHKESRTSIRSNLASRAAQLLFSKAKLASRIAKLALNSGSRRRAYEEKHRKIAAALRVCPSLFQIRYDYACRRYVVHLKNGPALHWKRLDEAI